MRQTGASDNIADMRSRLSRLVLTTSLVCTVAACQTPAPEGAKKDTPTTPDLKADATAANATAGAATAGAPGTADTAATAATVTAPGTAGAPETTAPPVEPTP